MGDDDPWNNWRIYESRWNKKCNHKLNEEQLKERMESWEEYLHRTIESRIPRMLNDISLRKMDAESRPSRLIDKRKPITYGPQCKTSLLLFD